MGQLLFKKIFWDAIRDGSKRTTIRRWTAARLKAGGRAFAPGIGWLAIELVEIVPDLSRLNDDDARADGFDSADAMRATLRLLYPDHDDDGGRGAAGAGAEMGDGRRWFRVAFRTETVTDGKAKVVCVKSSVLPKSRRATPTRRRRKSPRSNPPPI
jgi:hypothetical protein